MNLVPFVANFLPSLIALELMDARNCFTSKIRDNSIDLVPFHSAQTA